MSSISLTVGQQKSGPPAKKIPLSDSSSQENHHERYQAPHPDPRLGHRDRMDGAVVQVRRHTVTLTRTPAGLVAEVDGEACDLRRGVQILEDVDQCTVTFEELEPAPIGKAHAHQLHRLMALAGLHAAQHYALSAAALGEWAPVPSLATLTEQEARTVWMHLCTA